MIDFSVSLRILFVKLTFILLTLELLLIYNLCIFGDFFYGKVRKTSDMFTPVSFNRSL